MWKLQSLKTSGDVYSLLTDKTMTVGREKVDICLSSDPSVSRKHAVFILDYDIKQLGIPSALPSVKVTDESKFGTVVNGSIISGTVALKDGDVVKFGTVDSEFVLQYEPYIVTTSCLKQAGKAAVREAVRALGGHVMSEWRSDCQVLLMSGVSVTVKVICALVQQKPIVTPEYLSDLRAALDRRLSPPDPFRYLPPLAESQLSPDDVTFGPLPARTSLFTGLRFLFLNPKQFQKLSQAVELAGGAPCLLEEEPEDQESGFLTHASTRVMQCDAADALLSNNGREWVRHVTQHLARKKKRMIADSEIGFAVLYATTDRYCNPAVALDASVPASKVPSQSLSQAVPNLTQTHRTPHAYRPPTQPSQAAPPTQEPPAISKPVSRDSAFVVPDSLPEADPRVIRSKRLPGNVVVPDSQATATSKCARVDSSHTAPVQDGTLDKDTASPPLRLTAAKRSRSPKTRDTSPPLKPAPAKSRRTARKSIRSGRPRSSDDDSHVNTRGFLP